MYSKIIAFQACGTGKVITIECENKNEHIYNMKCLSHDDIFSIEYLDNDDDYSQYQLFDYFDVWSDGEGGWQVNDLRRIDEEVYFKDNVTDEELIDYLIYIGYLNDQASFDSFIIEDIGDIIEISYSKNSEPICRFEKVII